jgi:MFS family permease
MPYQTSSTSSAENERWYSGITRYQWLVLLIASLGWIFDVFEGQIFVASMNEAMPSLVPSQTTEGRVALYNNIALGAFLVGGALGGIVFGMLSDRYGRKRTMSWTILFYSLFTCLSAFSREWWHLAGFRFLVALGVGGEWAVASTMVAEVFPQRARAHVGSIFHASSVFGTYLAVIAATILIGNSAILRWAGSLESHWIAKYIDPVSLPWRLSFALGLLPALLIIWIRKGLREPESWQAAQSLASLQPGRRLGSIADLFRGELLRRTLVGLILAAVGLATFWGAHIYGKDMLRNAVERQYVAAAATDAGTVLKRWEMLGMFLVTTGGGIGLLAFGPISQWIGRRSAFLLFQVCGLVCALIVFQMLASVVTLLIALPIFGFWTLGMHAGYAVYFPELYPTRLRATGAGFCFNAGRFVAAPTLFIVGWLRDTRGYSLPDAATMLSLLFVVGIASLAFAPETRWRELPE